MYSFCNGQVVLLLSLSFTQNAAAYNVALLGSGGSSNTFASASTQRLLNSSGTILPSILSSTTLSQSSLRSLTSSSSTLPSSTLSTSPSSSGLSISSGQPSSSSLQPSFVPSNIQTLGSYSSDVQFPSSQSSSLLQPTGPPFSTWLETIFSEPPTFTGDPGLFSPSGQESSTQPGDGTTTLPSASSNFAALYGQSDAPIYAISSSLQPSFEPSKTQTSKSYASNIQLSSLLQPTDPPFSAFPSDTLARTFSTWLETIYSEPFTFTGDPGLSSPTTSPSASSNSTALYGQSDTSIFASSSSLQPSFEPSNTQTLRSYPSSVQSSNLLQPTGPPFSTWLETIYSESPTFTGDPGLSSQPTSPPFSTWLETIYSEPPTFTGDPGLSSQPTSPPFSTWLETIYSEPPTFTGDLGLSSQPTSPPFSTWLETIYSEPPTFTGDLGLSSQPTSPPFSTWLETIYSEPPTFTGDLGLSSQPTSPPFSTWLETIYSEPFTFTGGPELSSPSGGPPSAYPGQQSSTQPGDGTTTSPSASSQSSSLLQPTSLLFSAFPSDTLARTFSTWLETIYSEPFTFTGDPELSSPSGGPPSIPSASSNFANATVPASITAAPTPVSFINGQPVFAANATLPPTYDSGVLSLAYLGGNCSMAPGTDGYNAKSCSCVNSIVRWYYSYATATITTQQCQSTMIEGIATGAQSLGCSYNTVTELATPYVAPTECCNKCYIRASAVQLIYWPAGTNTAADSSSPSNHSITAAPAAPAAPAAEVSGLVSDGFTFISPSVYVVYTSIRAQASCVALVNSQTQVGPAYTVTRAYAPDAISSARCVAPGSEGMGIAYYFDGPGPPGYFQGIFNGWEAIDYAELANPPPASDLLSRYQSCFSNPIGSVFASQMFVTPQLSFPDDVTDIDREWQTWGAGTCTPIDLGVMDPPRALGSASALGPPPLTVAADPSTQPSPAAPGQTAALSYDPAKTFVPPAPAVVSAKNSPASPVDPDNETPDQMSQLRAALAPSPDPQNLPVSNPPGNLEPQLQTVPASNPKESAQPQPQAVPANSPITLFPVQPSPNAQVYTNTPANPAKPTPIIPAIQPLPLINNQPILQNTNSDLILAGSITLAPGSQTTVAGHVISNGGSSVLVDGSTRALQAPAAPSPQPAPAVAVAGQPAPSIAGQPVLQDAESNLIIAGSKTLEPGSQSTVAGHVISNGGSNLVVDGSTQALQPPAEPSRVAAPAVVAPGEPLPSIDGQPILRNANSDLIVAGVTVPPNSQTVVAGHTVSNGGSNLVIDANTQALQSPAAITPAPIIPAVGGQPMVQNPNSDLVVGGSTIPPGAQAIVAGHTVSNGGNNVVVDGSVQAIPPPTAVAPIDQIVQITNGNLKVGGQTIAPGSQATVSGHVIDFTNPSQAVVDGTTNAISPISTANPLFIGGQTAYIASNGGLVIGSSTIAPNSQATVSGQVFSLDGSSSVAVDGSIYALPPLQNAYIMQAAPSTVAPVPTGPITLSNGLVVTPAASAATPGVYPPLNLPNGAVISAGGPPALVSGTTYSVLPSNQGILVNGVSTLALPPLPSAPQSIFTVAGQIFTAAPTGFSIAGTSISPGAQAVTISGTVISLDASSHLQIGSSTIDLRQTAAPDAALQVFTIAGQTFTAAPTGFPIAGSTLTPGGNPIYLSGTLISLDASSHLQIGSSTIDLHQNNPTPTTPNVFTVAGQTFTAAPTGFVIAGTSITPGGAAVTVSGTPISLAPGGTVLDIGSSTITLRPQSQSADITPLPTNPSSLTPGPLNPTPGNGTGFGGAIISAFGAPNSGAAGLRMEAWRMGWVMGIGVVWWIL